MAKSKITEAARAFIGAPPVDAMRPQVVPSAKAVGAEARALGAATRRAVSPANQFVLAPALDSPRPTPRVPNKKELILDGKRTAERYVNARTAEPLDLDYRTGDKRTPFRQTPQPTNPSYRPPKPRLKPGAGPARTSTLGRVANNAKTAAAAVTNSVAAGPGAVNTGFLDSGSSTSRAKIDKMGKARQILNGVYRAPESGPGVVRRTAGAVANGAGRVADAVKAAATATGTSGLGVADRMRAGLNAATAARPATPAASAAQAGLVRRGLGATATGLGRVAGVAGRIATPLAATMSAYKSGTMSGEDRARFNKDFGVDSQTVAGDLVNNTANVGMNLGNSLTFGLAEKLGQGIGSWAGGGSFKEGWQGPTFDERGGPKPAEAGGRAPGGGAWTPSLAPSGWGDQANKENAQMTRDTTAITNANALADQMQRRSAAGGLMVAPNNRYDPDAAVYASGAVKDGGMYDKASPGTVIGQFNGRDITKAESEVRGGSLVTSSGPVAMGGGGFAASTGRSLAQQAAANGRSAVGGGVGVGGSAGAAGGQPTMQRRSDTQTGDSFGGYGSFRGQGGDPQARDIRGDLRGSDSERKSAIENIDAAIKSLTTENGGLNMRSKRELLGRYVEQRNEIATMPYDVQNRRDVEGARLDAEMSTRNADRGLDREKFQWDQTTYGIDRQDKIDAAEAARNAPPSAKELREADAYNLERRSKRDNDDEKQAADLAGQYLKSGAVTDPTEALTMANQALANLAMDTGQKFDTQSRTAGGVANIDQFNDEMSQNSDGVWSRAMAGRNPFSNNPTLNRNYDAANLEAKDYSWYNPRNLADAFVPGNQFDDSFVEGPRDANGLSPFRGLRGELEKTEFEKKRDRAAASRRSMPEY